MPTPRKCIIPTHQFVVKYCTSAASGILIFLFDICRLRTLSSQGGTTGPASPTKPLQTPLTPTTNLAKKFKLAEFRYGKEELLQLFMESELPPNMVAVAHICKEQPSAPLAFMPQSEEEQVGVLKYYTMYINLSSVLFGFNWF